MVIDEIKPPNQNTAKEEVEEKDDTFNEPTVGKVDFLSPVQNDTDVDEEDYQNNVKEDAVFEINTDKSDNEEDIEGNVDVITPEQSDATEETDNDEINEADVSLYWTQQFHNITFKNVSK